MSNNNSLNWHTMSMHLLKRLLLIAIISTLSVSAPCQSPNQAGINLGYGIWDGVHAGAAYRFDRYSAGLDFGWINGYIHRIWNGRDLTVAFNNNYYFRKRDEASNRETLIFLNPMYGYTEDRNYIRHVLFLSAGIGREISLSPSFSLGYQGGPILPVYGKTKQKTDIIENRAGFIIPLDLKLRVTYKFGRE